MLRKITSLIVIASLALSLYSIVYAAVCDCYSNCTDFPYLEVECYCEGDGVVWEECWEDEFYVEKTMEVIAAVECHCIIPFYHVFDYFVCEGPDKD